MSDLKPPRRGIVLMWAYLAFHARKCSDRELASWIYLLEWAKEGGRTSEVPAQFGGAT